MKQSFHLIFYGLEIEKLTTGELIEEIYHELKLNLGKIQHEDIIIFEEESLISKNIYD